MKNSDVFLASFNRIDKELKSLLTRKEFGFSRAVKILQKSNPLIKRYKDDLLEFAELRNAIVHNRTDVSYVIAEPHESIVESIIKIEEELTKPKIVYSYFAQKVYTVQANEKVLTLLEVIREKEFTKFPVYNGKEFLGLITQKGITNWLANELYNGNNIMIEQTLSDVLRYEDNGNYKFISGNSSLYEAVDMFKDQIGNGHRLEAILMTENGDPTESLVGIVTNWDIMKVGT
jgi:CBS domain-containing protein